MSDAVVHERAEVHPLARGFLLAGFAIAQTGVDPVELTEYAVIFSTPVLPLTYLPILFVWTNGGS